MKHAFFLLLTAMGCLAAGRAAAQQLRGRVQDAESGEPLSFVSVVDVNSQAMAYTDRDGYFSLIVSPDDEVAFNLVGYHGQKLRAAALLSRDAAVPSINLRRAAFSLGEVTVRPDWTPYQADSVQRQRTYQRVLSYHPSGSVMSPVSALAELFSKKKKQWLRFQKDFYSLEKERFTDTRYTPELVADQTHLSGDTLAQFMNQYPMPYDYARAASDLELKMWIRTNFKEWKAKGRPLLQIEAMEETKVLPEGHK